MKTYSFFDFSWAPCEIIHNNVYAYTSKCIICIPIYKNHLKETEKASLNQLCKIIGHSYEICLICPKNIELNEYINIAISNNVYLSFLFCSNDYFKSTETYSYMLETSQFYECFNSYEYLMIYQLDGWIFTNFLDYYINLNVDYIGSPWKAYIFNFNEDTVGNGGISLRKVSKFINICNKLKPEYFTMQYVENEDLFFCKTLRNVINLKFADVKNASNFSLQSEWKYFIEKYNDRHLPMCMHTWDKQYNVLNKYIRIEYNENKHLSNKVITYENLSDFKKLLKINVNIPKIEKLNIKSNDNNIKSNKEIKNYQKKEIISENKTKSLDKTSIQVEKHNSQIWSTYFKSKRYKNDLQPYFNINDTKKDENISITKSVKYVNSKETKQINTTKKPIIKKEIELAKKDIKQIAKDVPIITNTIKEAKYEETKYDIITNQTNDEKFINNIFYINDSLNTFYNITSDTIKYICETNDNSFITEISSKERIIITLTTWPPRINNIHFIIDRLLNNTLQPDIININLSTEEFPNKEKDLPNELLNDIKNNNKIKITWLKHNTTVWKKLIPTLYKYPNDIVIPVDDDFIYPLDFIETLYADYIKYDKKSPISGNKIIKYNMKCHCGACSLVKAEYMINNFNILNDEIYKAGSSDIFYTYCVCQNKLTYIKSTEEYFQNLKSYQEIQPYSGKTSLNKIENTYNACRTSYRQLIKTYKNNAVAPFIFNYRQDENARKLLNQFSTFFNTTVLDSGNDKVNDDFVQFDNIYYSGLINETKNAIKDNQDYKWIGIICSDIKITYDNLLKISYKLLKLKNTDFIGEYQPSFTKDSYNWLNNIQNDKFELESKYFLDGPCLFIRRDIFDKLEYININTNKFGWGITRVTSLYSLESNLLNVFDNTVSITHEPDKSGYPNQLAGKQLVMYFRELKVAKRIEKYMKFARKNNSLGSVDIKL